MVGVPVIINHKAINSDNANDERVGVVSDVWFDDKDGWYWCDGVIWDETAQNLITDQGWSVSCSYDVLKADDEGGSENNIPYDMEFLDGVFTHLALVNNPRYERANIVFNSKTAIVNSFPHHAGRPGKVGGSLPKGANSNLSSDIDKVIDGTFPEKQMLNFGTPPDILQKLGVPDKPMFMSQHKFLMSTERKEINGEIHHIADETMKDLPNLLKEPLLVMTSRKNSNRYVVALNAKDKNGLYIFAIIEYDWQGKKNNIIPSVYGKDSYLKYIQNAYLNNEIVYQNKNLKISGSQVQFPRCNQKVSNNIINGIQDKINPNVNEHEVNNDKEQEMELIKELKKLINKAENSKGEDMDLNEINNEKSEENEKKDNEVENEKVDKRKLIDEVGGILKGKVDEEIWRTVIGKIEKIGYNKSEAGTANNSVVNNESEEDREKVKELKEDMKKDVNNSKTDYFAKMNEVYNASQQAKEETIYVSRADRLKAGEEMFKV